jgi:rRNA maturation RNase YbeY
MKRLNSGYRKKSYATDVLSFGAPEPFRSQGWLGELVVCAPVLERQAREQGHSGERELDVLLAHGLLHLLGLDHERSQAEAERMSRLESRLLSGQGLTARGFSKRAR